MAGDDVFARAFAIVVGEEGGYGSNPADPGNWTGGRVGAGVLRGTKFGISAKAYPALDIERLTLADAQAIYRRDYWDTHRCGDLPPPLALLVFDAAVNGGDAARWLQHAVGADVDGDIGDETVAAAQAVAGRGWEACAEFLAWRLAYQSSLPTWSTFGAHLGRPEGWARRLFTQAFAAVTFAASG